MYPYYVERKVFHNQGDRYVPVPCGKCPNCLKRRTASWSHRLEIESLRWPSMFFVTLTYNTDHVPISNNTFMSLRSRDVSLFLKRLRKNTGSKIKYYLVGEYGTNNHRPHYHIILFTEEKCLASDIVNAWMIDGKEIGNVYFGKVEPGSIRYCVQYYDKGEWKPRHKNDDREPEFSRMSQGIGRNFLTEKMVKHLLDNPQKAFIYNVQGHKIAIPRYYKKRIYDYHGNDTLIANHPSLLVHRDEMLEKKEHHHKVIAEMAETFFVEEPETEDIVESRRMAIENYKRSKRKTRNI